MSREQWGHGYWRGYENGVHDAASGCVGVTPLTRQRWVLLYLLGYSKATERAVHGWAEGFMSVREVFSKLRFCGIEGKAADKMVKDLYDWVMAKEPLGCYISGEKDEPWTEDYFILYGAELAIEGKWWDECCPIPLKVMEEIA